MLDSIKYRSNHYEALARYTGLRQIDQDAYTVRE